MRQKMHQLELEKNSSLICGLLFDCRSIIVGYKRLDYMGALSRGEYMAGIVDPLLTDICGHNGHHCASYTLHNGHHCAAQHDTKQALLHHKTAQNTVC